MTEIRSRRGCIACRTRKKKCDEAKPVCRACQDREISCVYDLNKPRRRNCANVQLKPLRAQSIGKLSINNMSEASLVHHFRTHVVHLICFPSVDRSNPFYMYIFPLLQGSGLVHTAVEAVGAAHRHLLGAGPEQEAAHLHSRTLKLLASTLSHDNLTEGTRDQALGASLLLVYYEIVLGSSARVAQCHLRGAKSLFEMAVGSKPTDCFRFLYKIFQYFDVMVALSLREQPLGHLATDTEVYPGIDGTFGLLGTFWPLMQKLADVLARKSAGKDVWLDGEILTHQLQAWCPEETHDALDESNTDHQAMLQIARAYKYSSLLTLYTSGKTSQSDGGDITGQDNDSNGDRERIQQTYHQALDSLLRTCVLSGTMSTLVWPLYTVAMRAYSVGDKTITQHIFSKLNERQHMQVVKAASDSVKKSWDQPASPRETAGGILLG